MNEIQKTGLFVGAAAALVVIASMSTPGAVEPVFFSDVGEDFFPEFTDPEQAASLEVWEFDGQTGEAVPFSVKQDGGRWTIPSHHDYPADAKTRLANAAGLLIGLRKAGVRTDNKADHVALGVLDPLEPGLELEGRGKRVSFKNSAGTVLADLIIGNEVEGKLDQWFVRLPGKKRVYVAELDADLSTDFADWIEQDLLGLQPANAAMIIYDNYSVDETSGTLQRGEQVALQKVDNQWTLVGLAEGESTDATKAQAAVNAVTGLEIVGVRAKPDGLTAKLETASGIERAVLSESLARRGYFLSRGKLYSNEGDLIVHTSKGVVYTLKFGEVVYGQGSVLTSGSEESGRKKVAENAGANETTEETGSHRYLMITADFDQSLLPAPEGTPLPQEEIDRRLTARTQINEIVAAVERYQTANDGALPATLTALTEGDQPELTELPTDPWDHAFVLEPMEEGFVVASLGSDGTRGGEGAAEDIASDKFDREDEIAALRREQDAFDRKVEEGEAEAAKLTARFGPWYYVIDDESFRKLRLERADLIAVPEPEEAPPAEIPGGLIDPNK